MTEMAGPRRDNVGRGIALALGAVLIFSTQDAASKFLVQSDVSPFQMTMMRFWAFALFAVIFAWRRAGLRNAFRSKHTGLQIGRGLLLVTDIWLFIMGLATVPLAAAQSIVLIYPLLVTIFAIPFLGEKVGIFRISAVVVGFMGALLIVRPGGLPLSWGVGLVAASGATYALYLVLTRKVAADDPPVTSMLYTGVAGLLLSSGVGIFHWQMLDMSSFLLIGYIMFTGVAAHGMMIFALSQAPASILQPFNYTALPWSIVFSLVIFHEPIDAISLLGAAIIVGAGLVVMARERIKRVPISAEPTLPGKE